MIVRNINLMADLSEPAPPPALADELVEAAIPAPHPPIQRGIIPGLGDGEEVGVWDRALSDAEIAELSRVGARLLPSGVVHYESLERDYDGDNMVRTTADVMEWRSTLSPDEQTVLDNMLRQQFNRVD